jgi:hypothetical protein
MSRYRLPCHPEVLRGVRLESSEHLGVTERRRRKRHRYQE